MTSHVVVECERVAPHDPGITCERRREHKGRHYCIVRAGGRYQELVEWDDDGEVLTVDLP